MADRATWAELLGALIVFKEQLDDLDPGHTQPYTAPRVKATEADIAAAEATLGERLPDAYRQFLLHANGWPSFYFRADLFGTEELRGGGHGPAANQQLAGYQHQGVLEDAGLSAADVLPIGAGPPNMGNTLFLLVRNGRPNTGQVVWLDGEEIDRFDDFHQYIAAMLDYTRADVEKLRGASGQPSD